MNRDCPFCQIIHEDAPATVLNENAYSLEIVPLSAVVDGHTIVIPKLHRHTALADPGVTARTMQDAAQWTLDRRPEGAFNFITSVGVEATQSVFHLHIHVVPREDNDGLALPWYSGKSGRKPGTFADRMAQRSRAALNDEWRAKH